MHVNEQTFTILGFKIPLINVYVGWGFWPNEGEPHSVSFDPERVIKHRKWLLGFYHVHPNMLNYPSNIDNQTMVSWCNVVGRPLFCMIEGIDGEYSDNEMIAPIMISNYLFKTYPREDKHNKKEYIGHAYRIGKLFIWWKEL